MSFLARLLITIMFNLAVLGASVGWLGAQYRQAIVKGSVGGRETSVGIDAQAWVVENGTFPFR